MRVSNIEIEASPTSGAIRLSACVRYDQGEEEVYWYDVPEAYKAQVSTTGNPWLACLAPLSVTLGETLHIDAPVDAQLLENVHELALVWKSWYPALQPINVEAEVVQDEVIPAGTCERRTAAFFSGGVDSFFTVLQHEEPGSRYGRHHVQDLLCVWGFDVPLENVEAFARMRASLERAADLLGKPFIPVATNIRTTRWDRAKWGPLSHGCGLASVGLVLEARFATLLVGSTYGYADLQPWGSHPLTDPLLSTSSTRVVHDGAAYNRVQKTAFIACNDVVKHHLRVCWKQRSDGNCCSVQQVLQDDVDTGALWGPKRVPDV